jgi:chromatin remodeling complex protein RSC6
LKKKKINYGLVINTFFNFPFFFKYSVYLKNEVLPTFQNSLKISLINNSIDAYKMSNNSLSKEHKQMSKKVSKASSQEPVAPVVATPAPVVAAAAEPAKKVVVRKAKEATPSVPVVAAPVAPVEAAPAPVAEKKSRKTKETPVEAAPAVVAPVAVEPVATEPVVEATEVAPVETQLAGVVSATEALQKEVQSLASLLRRAVKAYGRERRVADKEVARAQRKRARKEGTEGTVRKPTSFQTPKAISAQLCEFLGVPAGTQMARTDVTKAIGKYVKDHGLQNTENKRKFTPDSKLSKLFGPLQAKHKEKGFEFFNLQTYLAPHFPKSA